MTLLSDANAAYLAPLLKKHDAGEPLIWEDLEAARVASSEILKKTPNAFVSKRMDDLHQTQVQAYREAAVKGLREWAQSEASLEPMEDNDTEDTFVERCVTAVVSNSSWPNWRLDSAKMVAIIEIRKRARAIFAKYHPISNVVEVETPTTAESTKPAMDTNQSQNNNNNNKENADKNNEDVEDAAAADDDGEVEDGEMDDDDEDEDGQVDEHEATKSTSDNGPKKKTMNAKSNNNNNTNNNKKKVVVRKKTTNIKQGPPRKGGPANRGGRRPGRGGANAGGAKSG